MLEWIDDITAFIFLHDAPQKGGYPLHSGNGHAEPSEYAAQLYHSGYAPLILPSGRFSVTTGEFDGQKSGARRYEGRFETEWAFMRAVLLANGVPDRAILREDEATFTYQNAIYSRRRTDAGKADRSPRHPVLHAGSRPARQDVLSDALPRNPASPLPRAGDPSPAKTGCSSRTALTKRSAS